MIEKILFSFVILLIAAWILCVVPYLLYGRLFRIKFLGDFYCKIMGWHSHSYDNTHYHPDDPLKFQEYAKCQWCDFEGMIDSQGNLF